jgi:hypothetical protein
MRQYIKLKQKIKDREKFVKQIAFLYAGKEIKHFSPYMPNDNDDSFWTIDMGNDWKIGFDDKKSNTFYIMYRYGDSHKEKVINFSKLIACKYDGKIINKEEDSLINLY